MAISMIFARFQLFSYVQCCEISRFSFRQFGLRSRGSALLTLELGLRLAIDKWQRDKNCNEKVMCNISHTRWSLAGMNSTLTAVLTPFPP